MSQQQREIVNRKAKFEYQFIDNFEAGIALKGTEVKSIKQGNANLSDAYCLFDKEGNLIVKSMYVAEYDHGNVNNHETRRDRRLLLRKPELRKIEKKINEKGMSLIPYRIYFSDRGLIKLELWLAQGKKAYDKRESIKSRESKRKLDRIKKEYQ